MLDELLKKRRGEDDRSWDEIGRELGITADAARKRAFRAAKRESVKYLDKRECTEYDVNEYYKALKHADACAMRCDTKQTSTTIKIDDDKPVGIAFWGDWHLGALGLDYEQFDADKAIIEDVDGLYYGGAGDYKDNYHAIKFGSTSDQVAPPGMQDLLVKQVIDDTAHKCLWLTRGCHDDFDHQIADRDFVSELCGVADAANLWHGGIVTLHVGGQEYRIMARHKYKNESGLNTTNVQRNMMNDFGPCDVFAVAHKHFADLQYTKRMGQDVIYLRSGSYKRYDEWGQKLAGYEGEHAVPVVIFFPNERRMMPFKKLRDGVEVLKLLRG